MGVINCDPDWDVPFCSGGIRYCCVSYQGGYDFRPCGTCAPTYRLSINAPSTFYAGQSVTVTGQLFNGTTPMPNVPVTVWFDWNTASWEGRLGAFGGTATTDANGNYSVTIPAWRFIIPADVRPLPRGWSFKATCQYCQSNVILNMEQGVTVDTVLDITSFTPAYPRTIDSVTVKGTLITADGHVLANVIVHPMIAGPADSGPGPLPDIVTDSNGIWTLVIPASLIESEPAGNWSVGAWTDSVVISHTLYNGTVLSITDHYFTTLCYAGDGIDESLCDSLPQYYSPDQGTEYCDGDGKHYILTETDTCKYCYVWDGTYCGIGCVPGATRPCSGGTGQEICKISGNGTVWDASGCYHSSCVEGAKRGVTICTDGTKKYAEICHDDAWRSIFPPETCPPICIPGSFDLAAQTLCPDGTTIKNHKICVANTVGNRWMDYTDTPCPLCSTTHPNPMCEADGYIYDCVNEIYVKTADKCCKTSHPIPECIAQELWECQGEEWVDTAVPCGVEECQASHPAPVCIDGFIWNCVDGVWQNTGVACETPIPDNTMLLVVVGGLAVAGIGVAAWMLRKPKQK